MAASDYYEFSPATKTVALSITSAPALTGTWSNKTAVYGTTLAPVFTPDKADAGEITYEYATEAGGTYSETVPTKAGTYYVKAIPAAADKYSASAAEEVEITKKAITIETTARKVLDGDTDMALNEVNENDVTFEHADVDAILDGDVITIADLGTAEYAEAGVHTQAITVTDATFTGTNADCYDVTLVITASITKQTINLTAGALALTKTYDGTTALSDENVAALEALDLSGYGAAGGADVHLAVNTLAYSDSKVHAAAGLTGEPVLAGENMDDYTLVYEAGDITGEITRAPLTVTAEQKAEKTGTSVAFTDLANVEGMQAGESADTVMAEGWTYADGVYQSADGNIVATFYEKGTDGTYAQVTGNLATGKTYYVDLKVTAGDYGDNYNLAAGLTPKDAAPEEATVDQYIEVVLKAAPSGGGGGGGSTGTTVTYRSGENGAIEGETSEKVKTGELPQAVPTVKANDGYKFIGWSSDGGKTFVDPTKVEVTRSVTYTAYFAALDHTPYMIGRPHSRFVPQGELTRAEAATMMVRLTDGFVEGKAYEGVTFTDFTKPDWYTNYVSFAVQHGIVEGYKDGTFCADRAVTRGEFAAIVARYLNLDTTGMSANFADCEGHWATGYIAALVEKGVIDGYPDGTFCPDKTITRAEAAKMVNAVVSRTPVTEVVSEHMSGYENPFVDVSTSDWYFYEVMEAALPHVSKDFH